MNEVKIGNQIWSTENLNLDKFRNGDVIPEAKSVDEWASFGVKGKPAWCYYQFSASNGINFGKLYNWYAINDYRKLAPTNWHIPDFNEWQELKWFCETKHQIINLKSSDFWEVGAGGNDLNFTALPSGIFRDFRNTTSEILQGQSPGTFKFKDIFQGAYWWSSSCNMTIPSQEKDDQENWTHFGAGAVYDSASAFYFDTDDINYLFPGQFSKMCGLSVRLCKD